MIPVKNYYYMLSYTFSKLRDVGYRSLATESFESLPDLCAEILSRGMLLLIRQGLKRDYLSYVDEGSRPHGKILMVPSLRNLALHKSEIFYSAEEYTENCYANRIIKTVMEKLFLSPEVSLKYRVKLKQALGYLGNVQKLPLNDIDWHIHFDRTWRTYRFLTEFCHLIVKGMIQSSQNGNTLLRDFNEETLWHLYEAFIREYFRCEFAGVIDVRARKIQWATDADADSNNLPEMKTDITLQNDNNRQILIIDAKYHDTIPKGWYGHQSYNSANLYQIFAYVKNLKADLKRKGQGDFEVAGMLLYAKTDKETKPYAGRIDGNKFEIRTLDLNCDFEVIRTQLNEIAESYLKLSEPQQQTA